MSLPCATALLLFVSFFLIAFPTTTISFDIAKILAQNPSFSTFNNYLAQTQLAPQINSRQTITVLAVDNAAMSPIFGKSMDTIKKVLSIHVILDYFDVNKLRNLNSKSVQVTTLYQTTGQAINQDGFLNLTHMDNDAFTFASSSQHSNGASILINHVASEPYNLSVIRVSSLIIPSTINNPPAHSNSPPPSSSPLPSPNSNHSSSPSPSSSNHDHSNSSSTSPSPSSSHHEHSNSSSTSPSSSHHEQSNSSSSPSPSSSHHNQSNSSSPYSPHHDQSNSSSSSPSPSSSHHDQSNSSSLSPSPSHHSSAPSISPSAAHFPSPVPVKSLVPVVSPTPVPVAVPAASPTMPPNADTPVASPPAPNAPENAPAPNEHAKSGAPTSTVINGAFLILITLFGALHIHILTC